MFVFLLKSLWMIVDVTYIQPVHVEEMDPDSEFAGGDVGGDDGVDESDVVVVSHESWAMGHGPPQEKNMLLLVRVEV